MMNLFEGIPESLSQEWTENLVQGGNVRIERVASRGHASPPNFWYDQSEHEWVVLLTGSAVVTFADGETVALGPGDWLEIPAHRKHRVERTDPDRRTVWLAVFYE
jgi:cupin 2 domain-containing protein